MSRQVFVDSSVPIYAVGGEHAHRDSCTALIQAAHAGHIDLNLSVEAIQEFTFHRLRRGDRPAAVAQGRALRGLAISHSFDHTIMDLALDLMNRCPIGGRDAIHAATALAAGFDSIITTDRDFDIVPGLRAVLPAHALD